MERDYFDAKFDGIEKLMASQESNLKGYIGAVSSNVKRLEGDLSAHKESTDAHGLKPLRDNASTIASWLGLMVAAGVAVVEFVRRRG